MQDPNICIMSTHTHITKYYHTHTPSCWFTHPFTCVYQLTFVYMSTHTHTFWFTHPYACVYFQPLFTCPHTHTHHAAYVYDHNNCVHVHMHTLTRTLNMHWYTCSKNYTCDGLIMMVKTHAFRCKVCPFECVLCRCILLNLVWRVQEATDSILIFYMTSVLFPFKVCTSRAGGMNIVTSLLDYVCCGNIPHHYR